MARSYSATLPGRPLAVLHLLLTMGETNAGYNEHCLPMAQQRDITICTFFTPQVQPAPGLALFAGNNRMLGFLRALRTALRARDYDVVHAHSVHVALLYLIATLLPWGRRAPATVFTVHTSFGNYKLRNRLLLLPVFARFGKLVCCSHASFASFQGFFRWLAGARLCVVQNGLDLARLDAAAAAQTARPADAPFTVLTVGRLIELKQPLVVLRAWQQSGSPGRLVYVGDGPLREHVLAASAAGVELAGLVPRERVYAYLKAADLFVSASRIEGLPVAVIEAMACGLPVILSDIPPHREIAADTEGVVLVPLGDAAAMGQAITRLRALPAAERARLGQQCRRAVERGFSLAAMHRGYAAVYAQALGQPAEVALHAS